MFSPVIGGNSTLLGLAVFLVLSAAWYVLLLNRILQKKKLEVDRLNITLETKVAERTEKVNTLLEQQIYLKGILQTVAGINKLLITSPNLEKLLKNSCERFVQHGHYGFSWIGLLEDEKIQSIYSSDDFEKYLAPPPYAVNDPGAPLLSKPDGQMYPGRQHRHLRPSPGPGSYSLAEPGRDKRIPLSHRPSSAGQTIGNTAGRAHPLHLAARRI